jgi:hypothetical protein
VKLVELINIIVKIVMLVVIYENQFNYYYHCIYYSTNLSDESLLFTKQDDLYNIAVTTYGSIFEAGRLSSI